MTTRRLFTKVPSLQRLTALYGAERGAMLRKLLCGEIAPDAPKDCPARTWEILAPYQRAVHAADVLAGTYGVESITSVNGKVEVHYLNTGETYAATLLFYASGVVEIGSWGDVVERQERRSNRFA